MVQSVTELAVTAFMFFAIAFTVLALGHLAYWLYRLLRDNN